MAENNRIVSESAIKATLVAFERTRELSKAMTETSETLRGLFGYTQH